jgi:hypothetical protein
MHPIFLRGLVACGCTALALLELPGSCRADSLSDARATVVKIQANIRRAETEISDRRDKIIAADLAIAINEAAINKAVRDGKTDQELVLRFLLVGLKAKKDTLIKQKEQWEQFLRHEQQVLPGWQAEVKRLGG